MSRYWLNPKPADPQEFQAQVGAVCAAYLQAPELEAAGTHVISTDEKTGMQALERTAPTKPARPGLIERREFEYERHGTLCLTANFNVATGKVLSPTLQPTRDEKDFARNIEQLINTDVEAGWIFVLDNLNTHSSESRVAAGRGHLRRQGRPRHQGQARRSGEHGESLGLPLGPHASDPLRVHAKALLVAEPG